MKREEMYGQILDSVQVAKEEIAKDIANLFVKKGKYDVPEDIKNELHTLDDITVSIFNIAEKRDGGDIYGITLNGKNYEAAVDLFSCQRGIVSSMPLIAEESRGEEEKTEDTKETEEIPVEEPEPVKEEPKPFIARPKEKPKPKALVFGGERDDSIERLDPVEPFIEDRSKSRESIYYDRYILKATKAGCPVSSTIDLFVAPLKVASSANPNVPIAVYAYTKGMEVHCSSYDVLETGNNIMTIEIDTFEILIRGCFDNDGTFISQVLTTGNSANGGDLLEVVSKESGIGHENGGEGHVRLITERGSHIDVFPMSLEDDESFVIVRYNDFIDYYKISADDKSGNTQCTFYEDEHEVSIVGGWENDYFTVEQLY